MSPHVFIWTSALHNKEGNFSACKHSIHNPWGTFMYAKMSFGLMNAGATFQRAMDIAFAEEKEKFVVVYMDDITVYSRWDKYHVRHLERVFIKC